MSIHFSIECENESEKRGTLLSKRNILPRKFENLLIEVIPSGQQRPINAQKRWMSVTAPVLAWRRFSPACLPRKSFPVNPESRFYPC